jgi:hypothetical protein
MFDKGRNIVVVGDRSHIQFSHYDMWLKLESFADFVVRSTGNEKPQEGKEGSIFFQHLYEMLASDGLPHSSRASNMTTNGVLS